MDRNQFNILLDELPQEWEGIPIDSDFQIGIQMFWALGDEKLSNMERINIAGQLLFGEEMPGDYNRVVQGINWFLGGWNTDNIPKDKVEQPVMDYQQDQWRIWTAFLRQYGINLNRKRLHFWEFMALLRNLDECSFTRVVDIRTKPITGKMSAEEKKFYTGQKGIYALKTGKKPDKEYTEEELKKIDAYDRLMVKRRSEAEEKRIKEFMKYAACQQDMMDS